IGEAHKFVLNKLVETGKKINFKKTAQIMKTQSSILSVVFAIVSIFALTAQEHTVAEHHGHSHYAEHDSVTGHKLMFPSKTPDRIIANLTVDPAHSFAVNWRTDQQVAQGVVEVAVATDGPESVSYTHLTLPTIYSV